MAGQVDFEESHRQLIRELASKMSIASGFLYVAAVGLLYNNLTDIESWVSASLLILLGVLNARAAAAFKVVASAGGSYFELLIDALGKVKSFYNLVVLLVAVVIGIAVIALVIDGVRLATAG